MAGPTCSGCGSKAKKNQTLCDVCKKKVSDAQQGTQKEVCNEVLMYANHHRQTSTKDCVVAALVAMHLRC